MNREVCGNHALLQCFAEGTLAPDEAAAIKAHVAACPSCRIAVSEYKQIMWDLERPPEVELPAELEDSYQALMEAWQKERQGAAAARRSGAWLPSLVPPWAAPLLALPSRALSSWALSSRTDSPRPSSPQESSSRAVAPQESPPRTLPERTSSPRAPSLSLPSYWTTPSRNFLSWTARSVSWTRVLPGINTAQSLVRRTGSTLIERALPRWMRRKGGGND